MTGRDADHVLAFSEHENARNRFLSLADRVWRDLIRPKLRLWFRRGCLRFWRKHLRRVPFARTDERTFSCACSSFARNGGRESQAPSPRAAGHLWHLLPFRCGMHNHHWSRLRQRLDSLRAVGPMSQRGTAGKRRPGPSHLSRYWQRRKILADRQMRRGGFGGLR
jgi:hypothetical protein